MHHHSGNKIGNKIVISAQETLATVDGLVQDATYFVDVSPVTNLKTPTTFTYPLYLSESII